MRSANRVFRKIFDFEKQKANNTPNAVLAHSLSHNFNLLATQA